MRAAASISLACALSMSMGAQAPTARASARIFRMYADSDGQLFAAGTSRAIVSVRDRLEDFAAQPGATVWFSWAGAPARRTPAQQHALARLERSTVRVELRSDSTLRARLLRNPDEHVSVIRRHDTAIFVRTNERRHLTDTTMYVRRGDVVSRVMPGPPRDLPPDVARGIRRFFMK